MCVRNRFPFLFLPPMYTVNDLVLTLDDEKIVMNHRKSFNTKVKMKENRRSIEKWFNVSSIVNNTYIYIYISTQPFFSCFHLIYLSFSLFQAWFHFRNQQTFHIFIIVWFYMHFIIHPSFRKNTYSWNWNFYIKYLIASVVCADVSKLKQALLGRNENFP